MPEGKDDILEEFMAVLEGIETRLSKIEHPTDSEKRTLAFVQQKLAEGNILREEYLARQKEDIC